VYLGSPPDNVLCRPIRLVPQKSVRVGGWMKRRQARAKIIVVLFETFTAFLPSLNRR